MSDKKTLGYDWEYGHVELMLKVDAYAYDDGLYIGLMVMENGLEESFGDLTINLAQMPAEINEAYINDFSSKSKLKFIRKHKLGKVLPEQGYSGRCVYYKVAFDLDRLEEFDKEGVERYRSLHSIS